MDRTKCAELRNAWFSRFKSPPPSGWGDFFWGDLVPQHLSAAPLVWSTTSLAGLFQCHARSHFDLNRSIRGQNCCGSDLHGFLTEAGKTGSKAGEEEHFYRGEDRGRLFFRMDRRHNGDWWRDWLTIFVHLLNQSATDA
ncbi:MAG: hypothetical protein E5X74_32750 [Mesorhizobium sp.]|uniref:hypothetical protein n=1 Tax=Mesorhizobium sp. TaxID=1871066 RepID=UPI000FE6F843|nr:hypothetical protein [Mesorhizobium sp.]RWM16057.1 MAG: hypothetical protein EOR74_34225 [Mesorhizobium sp.]TIO73578.1 MAG: hypothetical protein E5X75_27825 [Mesorhizobium sp.]TIO80476.1 MAG: hypothetical protein E5X74_32750 [Mesorhizobium sp.]